MSSQTPDWSTLLQAIPAVITQVDAELRVLLQFNAEDSGLETPPGQVFLAEHSDELQTLVTGETPVRLDTRVTEPDTIWYRHHVRRIDGVAGLLISSLVVTRLKTAEANLEQVRRWFDAIMQNSTDAIAISTVGESYNDSHFIIGNRRLEELTGYSLDELRQMRPSQLLADEMLPTIEQRYQQRKVATNAPGVAEGMGKRKDGTTFPFESLALTTPNNELITLVRDITKRKQREEELLKARLQAETALKVRDIFIANMSHELRNPINTMLGYVQLLLESPSLSSEMVEYLRHVEYGAEHLGRFIGDVLDLSRVEAGFDSLHPTTFDLRNLIKRLGGMLDIQAKRKRLDFAMKVADDFPGLILMDEVKLKQILINLVDNAIKYTDSGTITVQVQAEGRNQMRLHVIDTGRGLSEDDLMRMFAPYERDEVEEQFSPGSGLGLAITQRLVALIGGEITIRPGDERGTIVTVTLPYTHAPDTGITPSLLDVYSDTKHKILVVDDEIMDRQVLVTFLKRRGFEVQTADTGAAALKIIAHDEPDLVFLDYRLPVMDGVTTLRHIREHHAMPIIAITADMLVENRQRLLDAGCSNVILKPYRLSTIAELLAQHLDVIRVNKPQISQPNVGIQPDTAPSVEELTALPVEWLQEMYEICLAGDHTAAREHLQQIEGEYSKTAAQLGRLVDRFWTTRIAEAIAPLLGK